MKKIIYLLLPLSAFSQSYPVIQEFNPPLTWSTTNGAGIQNYGAAENYLTTNVGNTPYPNGSTILMTSPVASYSNCLTMLNVSFPLTGIIENNWDFMSFQYSTNGGTTWVNVATYTGSQNTTYSYSIPSTANRFRFRLVTDATVNTYGPPGNPYVYYYDIARFTINCSAAMPVDLAYFRGHREDDVNVLEWKTLSERNSDRFEIYRSEDFVSWVLVSSIAAAGDSNTERLYMQNDNSFSPGINYYKLVQVDIDGSIYEHDVVSIDNRGKISEHVSITNILGQRVYEDYKGLVIVTYADGTVKKIYR